MLWPSSGHNHRSWWPNTRNRTQTTNFKMYNCVQQAEPNKETERRMKSELWIFRRKTACNMEPVPSARPAPQIIAQFSSGNNVHIVRSIARGSRGRTPQLLQLVWRRCYPFIYKIISQTSCRMGPYKRYAQVNCSKDNHNFPADPWRDENRAKFLLTLSLAIRITQIL
jgi:hypothetical protein